MVGAVSSVEVLAAGARAPAGDAWPRPTAADTDAVDSESTTPPRQRLGEEVYLGEATQTRERGEGIEI